MFKNLKKFKQEDYLGLAAKLIPLLFAGVTIFFSRSRVGVFFTGILVVLVLEFIILRKLKVRGDFKIGYILLVIGCIGLVASSVLSIEKMELLKNPNYVTSCSLSPVVACSPVIASPEASAFGLPNPFLGLFGFGCLIAAGMSLLAGGKFKGWWWQALWLGSLFGSLFSIWLIHGALYEIGALCLYCMSVWLISFTAFWVLLEKNVKEGYLSLGKKVDRLVTKYPTELIVLSYTIVALLILTRWWNYWVSLI
jgi:uncharacterized membrane protein